jgi:hypothetical protein
VAIYRHFLPSSKCLAIPTKKNLAAPRPIFVTGQDELANCGEISGPSIARTLRQDHFSPFWKLPRGHSLSQILLVGTRRLPDFMLNRSMRMHAHSHISLRD